MMRLLVCIVLGLVATSGGVPQWSTRTRQQTPQDSSGQEDCRCVQYSLCRNSTTIDEYGRDVINIRSEFDGCKFLEACCKVEDIIPPKPIPKTNNQCGVRNPEGVGFKMIGDVDHEAEYGEFPWMMVVLREYSKDGSTVSAYVSGGSLIHPQVVLTAAHYVKGKGNFIVRAGEWDTQNKNEPYPTQNSRVRKVIVHEEFEGRAVLNDVALLFLEKPFDTSVPHVKTICLPEPDENMDGRNCVTSGWGKDKFGDKGKFQALLKKIDGLPMVPKSRCQEALRETRLGPGFRLHESFVCAGGIEGKDTCKGDGGGPLVCPSRNDPDVYVQAGIVAWGIGCNDKTPGVYVDVPRFVNWIENKLQTEELSSDF